MKLLVEGVWERPALKTYSQVTPWPHSALELEESAHVGAKEPCGG